jgi:5-formyltetrahydrofolate cyclo-ligase
MPKPDDIARWRRERRAELQERRHAVSREDRRSVRHAVNLTLRTRFSGLDQARIGFYWTIRDEIDVRPGVEAFLRAGAEASLPVIVERGRPLEFWKWDPGTTMDRGVWDIPVPAERHPVQPTVLLVPVLGFDEDCFRLGYGGGYYDRTLAIMSPRPSTIGIGYEDGRLDTVFPQEHDIALDAIVTETRVIRRS